MVAFHYKLYIAENINFNIFFKKFIKWKIFGQFFFQTDKNKNITIYYAILSLNLIYVKRYTKVKMLF